MPTRCRRLTSLALTLALLNACVSYRPIEGPLPSNETVRVRFDSPREMQVPEDPSGMLAVRELVGRVQSDGGDSVAISVLRVSGDGRSYKRDGSTVMLARGPGATIQKGRFDAVGTLILVGVVVGAVVGVALASSGSLGPSDSY